MSLKYVKAFVLGMTSKEEIDENVRMYERLKAKGDEVRGLRQKEC